MKVPGFVSTDWACRFGSEGSLGYVVPRILTCDVIETAGWRLLPFVQGWRFSEIDRTGLFVVISFLA
jgi:hypothetical protein